MTRPEKAAFVAMLLLVVSCDHVPVGTLDGARDKVDVNAKPDTLSWTMLSEQGLMGAHVEFFTITSKDSTFSRVLQWGIGDESWSEDLDALTQGEGYRIPPTLEWHNRDYICLMTNHTGPFSQHLFLPLRKDLKPRFYSEDVEYADSLDNFVCFIDSVDDLHSKVHWEIVSLYDGKGQPFQTAICGLLDGYPWHTGVTRIDDSLVLGSPCERNGRIAVKVISTPTKEK